MTVNGARLKGGRVGLAAGFCSVCAFYAFFVPLLFRGEIFREAARPENTAFHFVVLDFSIDTGGIHMPR